MCGVAFGRVVEHSCFLILGACGAQICGMQPLVLFFFCELSEVVWGRLQQMEVHSIVEDSLFQHKAIFLSQNFATCRAHMH